MFEWREFEELVARIEGLWVPKGATVTSPDRIRDLVTGQLREVDASIRTKVGSAELLVTVECRRRNNVEDDTWIEQLATKREKIGAARTIAVSSMGFSEPATKTARLKGIELRRLKDITDDEITQQWLSGFSIDLIVTDYHAEALGFVDEKGNPIDPTELHPDLNETLNSGGTLDKPVLYTVEGNQPVTLNDLIARAPIEDLPTDGIPVQKTILSRFAPGSVWVQTVGGHRLVSMTETRVTFRRELKPVHPLSLLQYEGPRGTIMEVVQGDVVLDDSRLRIQTLLRRGSSDKEQS